MSDFAQLEPSLPSNTRDVTTLLPRIYRTESNKKFFNSTLTQLTTPGTVKKIVSFIGRQYSKATTSGDVFVQSPDSDRQAYQLEPAAIIRDERGNVTFYKDYIDHINHVDVLGGNVLNHERLNGQEYYSWNPHICWDKFVNYQDYYWQSYGPRTITIFGQQSGIQSTYNVSLVNDGNNYAYVFGTEAEVRNPDITLYRNQTYTFNVDAPNNKLVFRTSRMESDAYTDGVVNNNGVITFIVNSSCPNVLYYMSESDPDVGGVFKIFDIDENSSLNVESDILGKTSYTMSNGVPLSNGMKIRFAGKTTPEKYRVDEWYVEGVGDSIKLINDSDLEITASYISEAISLFDNEPFDTTAFGAQLSRPTEHEYIVINRSSPDRNPWSRVNRWFHKDVLSISEELNGGIFDLDQSYRAVRPIIEFDAGLKLYNFGATSKANVDLIDTHTSDVFSTIEGSLGYYIDGVPLDNGMRVLFTADTDKRVVNKTYRVQFDTINVPHRQITFNGLDIDVESNSILVANHGLVSGYQVTYLDNGNPTITSLTNRRVYYVNVVKDPSGEPTYFLELYTDPGLTKIVDLTEQGAGDHTLELYQGNRRQIRLIEDSDVHPNYLETVLVNYGLTNQGNMFWFDGDHWIKTQVKSHANQAPLFDLFDQFGNSYSDVDAYPYSNFSGTKVFSYKVGEGKNDTALGFPLSYRNINNIGDISFEFNLLKDTFTYITSDATKTLKSNAGYLMIYDNNMSFKNVNGWETSKIKEYQPVVRVYKESGLINDFPVDMFDDIFTITDLKTRVYINGYRLNSDLYSVKDLKVLNIQWDGPINSIDVIPNNQPLIEFNAMVYIDDVRLAQTEYDKIGNQIILKNATFGKLTLKLDTAKADSLSVQVVVNNEQILDHNITGYSYRAVVLNSDVTINDIVTLKCFTAANKNTLGFYEIPINLQNNPLNEDIVDFTLGQVIDHVNSIIDSLPNQSNIRDQGNISGYGTKVVQHSGPVNLSLYHLGPTPANIINALEDAREDYRIFRMAFISRIEESGIDSTVSNQVDSVLNQLLKDKPKRSKYYLSDMFAYSSHKSYTIPVLDSRNTIYPLYEHFDLKTLSNRSVLIYLNDKQLIHGKDYTFGDNSFFNILTTLAVDDKIEIHDYESTDGAMCPATPTKLGLYPKFKPKKYLDTTLTTPVNVIQGHDGSIIAAFDDYRDDLILELELRIFNNIKVEYDPSIFDIYDYIPGISRPLEYTSDEINAIMAPSFYQWAATLGQDYTKSIGYDANNWFTYNYRDAYDQNGVAVPGYWRGIFKWFLDTDRPNICPWEMLGFSLKPDWWNEMYGEAPYTSDNLLLWEDLRNGIIREPNKPVTVNKKFIRPLLDIVIPVSENGELLDPATANMAVGYIGQSDQHSFAFGDVGPVEAAWRRSTSYPFALIATAILLKPNQVLGTCLDRSRIVKNLCNQFVNSDTNTRLQLSNVAITSTIDDNTRTYTAGLINYIVDGISSEVNHRLTQYKYDLSNITSELGSKLGGFTAKNKYNILLDSKSPSSSGGVFVPEENYDIILNTTSSIKKVSYSGVIITRVDGGFEISGYNILEPYFKYHNYQGTERVITVGGVSENFVEWQTNQAYSAGMVVSVQGTYYRVKTTHNSGTQFSAAYYNRLPTLPIIGGVTANIRKHWNYRSYEVLAYGTVLPTTDDVSDFMQGYGAYLTNIGFVFDYLNQYGSEVHNWESSVGEFLFWTTQNWATNSTLSVSPAAHSLTYVSKNAMVNDIFDPRFKYQIYNADHQKLEHGFITSYREVDKFNLKPMNTTSGIYGATLYLIQKEHVLVLDNTTIFNDVIYDKPFGYKQDRVKVIGYISDNWSGGFNIPGFVYDSANIVDWEPWTDYALGDTVKHKELYYSAKRFTAGTDSFIDDQWIRLADKPVTRLIPNWDYRSSQFADFYDLDTDNFDSEQQRLAQHLIGYQKRQYLSNIINDDVSQYKFYQGMIIEKGTLNVFNKLFDVLSEDGLESVQTSEEWAVRVGQYGATNVFDELEFTLDEGLFKLTPQPLKLSGDPVSNVIDLTPVISSGTFDNNNTLKAQNPTQFLRTPGYVRYEDVTFAIDNLQSLLTSDILVESLNQDEYVWCGFEGREWNVYAIEYYGDDSITSIHHHDNANHSEIELTIPSLVNDLFKENDIVGLHFGSRSEFVEIHAVNYNSGVYTFRALASKFEDVSTITGFSLRAFTSCRVSEIMTASTISSKLSTINKPIVWVDNYDGLGWHVFNKDGTIRHKQSQAVDINNIKRVYLYNTTSTFIEYLDLVDINIGKIPGVADQELGYKTFYDPAVYSIGDNDVVVDEGSSWTTKQVGGLWWDLTRAKFIVNQGDDITYRASTWNQLFKTASIDVYEWVESPYLPSDWDAISNTDGAEALGISGTSRYGDSAYSVVRKYDTVSQTYTNMYYFWVLNKETVPNVPNRTLSAASVSNLIASPLRYGYKCMSLIGVDSFVLVNIENELQDKNINLSMQYWTSTKRDNNIHSEWKLISEDPKTTIPKKIEQKWIDSLIGVDYNDNQLPNYKLAAKLRYGVENSPLQSMFVNRIEALKLFITRINQVLKPILISDNYDISDLSRYHTSPDISANKWDKRIDSDYNLKFIATDKLERAVLTPVIINGRISDVTIVNPGRGYVNGPEYTITSSSASGMGARLSISLTNGSISNVEVLDTGAGYPSDAIIKVRPFSVLLDSAEKNDYKWGIYGWNESIEVWELLDRQIYDTTRYWSYIDWYKEGYDQFTKIQHVVENTNDLLLNRYEIGEILKVSNAGTGGWLIAVKTGDVSEFDYTQNYDIVGRQNGTIQFKDNLYTYDKSIHVATAVQPDPYYSHVSTELRTILYALRDKILINELKSEYLKTFFSSIRYIMKEQPLVDWIFKTSYIKATHVVGNLKQKVNYNSDNLQNFEDYINEVKPYRTKVREYISAYTNLDNSGTMVTDFDLQPVVNSDKVYYPIYAMVTPEGQILTDQEYTNKYPWKSWMDNVGFSVTDINIIDGGEGYTIPPIVTITGGYGSGAEAVAYLSNGKVNRIKITSNGSGYLTTPRIEFDGLVAVGGKQARAAVVISNSLVRSNAITMRYDRVSKESEFEDILSTESFVGAKNTYQYSLYWLPQLDKTSIKVLINNKEILFDQYSIIPTRKKIGNFTRPYGILNFYNAPNVGDLITISYRKDPVHLFATDRIKFYHTDSTTNHNSYEDDVSQLMIGVDYAGVIVAGAAFKTGKGWDTVSWGSDVWDSFVPTFDNYNTIVDYGTEEIQLPYVPGDRELLNIYLNGVRVDSDNIDPLYRSDTFEGDGSNDLVPINPASYELVANTYEQVAKNYNDSNLIITSTFIKVPGNIGSVLDSFNPDLYQSVRYKAQVIGSTSYAIDFVVFHNGSTVSLAVEDHVLVDGTLTASFNNGEIVLTFTPSSLANGPIVGDPMNNTAQSIVDISFIMVKWMYVRGNNSLPVITDGMNDTNFILSTDKSYTYDVNDTQIIDEFEQDLFTSGCYYFQLSDGVNVQVCEVELIHNSNTVTIEVVGNHIIGNSCGTFTAELYNGSVRLLVHTLRENLTIVYSRLLLAGLIANTITMESIRRLSNGEFSLTTFDFESRNTDDIVVDSFDILKCTSVRYQIQLSVNEKVQLLDLMASTGNDEALVAQSNININGSCGSFSGAVIGGIYRLTFQPFIAGVTLNAVKTMIGYSYSTLISVLHDHYMVYDIKSLKTMVTQPVVIDSYGIEYDCSRYRIQLRNALGYYSCDISIVLNEGVASMVQYSDIALGENPGTFSVDYDYLNTNTVQLTFTPTTIDTDIVMLRLLMTSDSINKTPKVLSNNNVLMNSTKVNITNYTKTLVNSFDSTVISSVRYICLVSNANETQYVELRLINDGANVDISETCSNGQTFGEFTAEVVNGTVNLWYKSNMASVSLVYVQEVMSRNSQLEYLENSVPYIKDRNIFIEAGKEVTVGQTTQLIDSFDLDQYSNGYYQIQAVSGGNMNIIELHFMHNLVTVDNDQYSIMTIGDTCGDFTCNIASGNVNLVFTPAFDEVAITYVRTLVNGNLSEVDVSNKMSFSYNFGKRVSVSIIKETCDGSIDGQPFDFSTGVGLPGYDSNVVGGQFYGNSNVSGFNPEDFVTDGGDFDHSSAPEELVPGYITDTVSIKTYQRPVGGSPVVMYKNYIADGIQTVYDIGQSAPSDQSVIVKVDNVIMDSIDYMVVNDSVIFNNAVLSDSIVSIISLGISSEFMLDYDSIITRGITTRYVTRAPWLLGKVKATVVINGILSTVQVFRTDGSDDSPELVGIRFDSALPEGTRVAYLIESIEYGVNETTTACIAKSDVFTTDSGTTQYVLPSLTMDLLSMASQVPLNPSVLVKVDGKILTPNPVFYYIMQGGSRTFTLPSYVDSNLTTSDIQVFMEKEQVFGFTYSSANRTINLDTYQSDATISIVINRNSQYSIELDGSISFNPVLPDGSKVEVTNFYNYRSIDIERTVDTITTDSLISSSAFEIMDFKLKKGGIFILRSPVLSISYVWIIKNNIMLTPNYDYILDSDMLTVRLKDELIITDVVQVVSFGTAVTLPSLGFMQFKDISNQDHYLRLNKNKSTKLAADLKQTDTTISVIDASVLNQPVNGHAGVIEINGERIEFYNVVGNTLIDIRRGVLGTSVPTIHRMNLNVIDLGIQESIPYKDSTIIETLETKRTTTVVPLRYVPKKNSTGDGYGFSDELEVFVGGVRMHKSTYTISSNGPSDDITVDSGFKVNGVGSHIRLTTPVPKGIRVVVIKKQGKIWTDKGKTILESNNPICDFLKGIPTVWPQYLMDKYQYTLLTDSSDTLTTDDNNVLEID